MQVCIQWVSIHKYIHRCCKTTWYAKVLIFWKPRRDTQVKNYYFLVQYVEKIRKRYHRSLQEKTKGHTSYFKYQYSRKYHPGCIFPLLITNDEKLYSTRNSNRMQLYAIVWTFKSQLDSLYQSFFKMLYHGNVIYFQQVTSSQNGFSMKRYNIGRVTKAKYIVPPCSVCPGYLYHWHYVHDTSVIKL